MQGALQDGCHCGDLLSSGVPVIARKAGSYSVITRRRPSRAATFTGTVVYILGSNAEIVIQSPNQQPEPGCPATHGIMSAKPKVSTLASTTPRSRGRAGVVVLLALAWFQVAFASHQFEHVTGDLFDVCTLCKHMERHDAAVAQTSAESLPSAPLRPQVAEPASPASANGFRNYESRAPPSA